MRYKFNDVARDGNGIVVRGATVSVYLAGTTTAASIYSSSTSTTAVNSVTTSATTGAYEFYVDAFDYGSYQKYKLTISKTGFGSTTIDDLSVDQVVTGTYTISTAKTFSNPVFIPSGVTFTKATGGSITISSSFEAGAYQVFSSFGAGEVVFSAGSVEYVDPKWFGTLNTTITVISSNSAHVRLNYAETLTANLTIPATCALTILKTGSITKASTYTLAINGAFSAGSYQVFSSFGAGDVTGLKEINPKWFGTLNTAITVISTNSAAVKLDYAETLTANLTVPTTCSLEITKTGSIAKASTYTLTINGPFSAGLYQVFSGFSAGDVTFGVGSVNVISPVWFGAVGDGATDVTTAIASAIASLPSTGGIVELPFGSYVFSSRLTVDKANSTIMGQGCSAVSGSSGATTLLKKSTLNDVGIYISALSVQLENFTLLGENGNGGDGIQTVAGRTRLDNIAVYAMGNDGIRIGDAAGSNANLWSASNIYTKGNGRHGFSVIGDAVPDVNAGTLIHLDSQSNTSDGLYTENAWLNNYYNVTVQTNGRYGIYLGNNAKYNHFFGGDIMESNVTKDLYIDTGAVGNTILPTYMDNSHYTDNGTDTMIEEFVSTSGLRVMRGLTRLFFSRNSSNAIAAGTAGGYFAFVTNGDAVSDANAQLLITTTGVGIGKSGTVITKHLSATTTWNPGDLADGASETKAVTVTGAVAGNTVTVGFPMAVSTVVETGNWQISGRAGTDVVYVTITNKTGGNKNLDSATLRVDVWQH